MNERRIESLQQNVSECGLGCWQLGGDWGVPAHPGTAEEILDSAYKAGIRFYDTADVYGAGASEEALGAFRKRHPDVVIATKLGRTGDLYPDQYTEEGLWKATEASLKRLQMDRLDLTQLHCIPPEVLRQGRVFDWLRRQKKEGLIRGFGVSVETVEEGLLCLEQEGLASLQVIFNLFRQKPAETLFQKARERGVGIIVRLPLASGLLTGKFTTDTQFRKEDHRHFNRDGQMFNVGETFAGLPFEKGVALADELKELVPEGMSLIQMSLRWILDHDAVTVMIPGASSPQQAQANAAICDLPNLSEDLHQKLHQFYLQHVHTRIRGAY